MLQPSARAWDRTSCLISTHHASRASLSSLSSTSSSSLTDLELTMPPRWTRNPGGSFVIVRNGNSGMSLSGLSLALRLDCFSELELPTLVPYKRYIDIDSIILNDWF